MSGGISHFYQIPKENIILDLDSRTIGHVRYINILTLLRGFQDKLLYCTEAYRCHPTSDFKNPTNSVRHHYWLRSAGSVQKGWRPLIDSSPFPRSLHPSFCSLENEDCHCTVLSVYVYQHIVLQMRITRVYPTLRDVQQNHVLL